MREKTFCCRFRCDSFKWRESDTRRLGKLAANGPCGFLSQRQVFNHFRYHLLLRIDSSLGGRVQTGCSNLFVGAVTDIIWTSPAKSEGRSLCNHRRAYKFFIDSVAPRCLFPAFPCGSYEDFQQGKCFHCPNRKAKSIRSNGTSQEV